MTKIYTVYHIDFLNNERVPIGSLVERRQAERKDNAADMLRLARKLFADSSIERLHIAVSSE